MEDVRDAQLGSAVAVSLLGLFAGMVLGFRSAASYSIPVAVVCAIAGGSALALAGGAVGFFLPGLCGYFITRSWLAGVRFGLVSVTLTRVSAKVYNVAFGKELAGRILSSSYVRRAVDLTLAANSALKNAPLSRYRREAVQRQSSEVLPNVLKCVQRLVRLASLKELARGSSTDAASQVLSDIRSIESPLRAEISRSLDVLASIPVSLVKVEVAGDEAVLGQLLADLAESNQRLRDLADARAEVDTMSHG